MGLRYFLLLFLLGCSIFEEKEMKQDLDQVYIGSGVERFALSDLPEWANFSSIGQCKRSEPIRFLNFENMYKSYSMDYEQLVQFQYMLNRKFSSYKQSTNRDTIFLKDESYILYNVHQQIIGGGRDFIVPNFKRIHLVWIDEAISNVEAQKRLKKIMYSPVMESGHPIFVSTCLSAIELEKFISEKGFSKLGVKGISQEMFTPYGVNFKIANVYGLDFSALMPGKVLYLFGPSFPKEFQGINDKNKIKY